MAVSLLALTAVAVAAAIFASGPKVPGALVLNRDRLLKSLHLIHGVCVVLGVALDVGGFLLHSGRFVQR